MAYLVIFIIIVLVIFVLYRMGQKSGYVLYHAVAKASLDKDGDHHMAIYRGLEQLSYRAPFNTLGTDDITYVAMLMAPLKDITLLKGFIIDAEKKRDASVFKNGEKLRSFVQFVKSNR